MAVTPMRPLKSYGAPGEAALPTKAKAADGLGRGREFENYTAAVGSTRRGGPV